LAFKAETHPLRGCVGVCRRWESTSAIDPGRPTGRGARPAGGGLLPRGAGKQPNEVIVMNMAKIALCDGDVVLCEEEQRTRLVLVAPSSVHGKSVEVKSQLSNAEAWEELRRKASKFAKSYPKLTDELEKLERDREIDIAEEGAEAPKPQLLHSLEVRYSRDAGIQVRGPGTFDHRNELKGCGLEWSTVKRAWVAPFSEAKLAQVSELVRRLDVRADPVAAGYVRCSCGAWIPRDTLCPCVQEKLKHKVGTVQVRFLKAFGKSYGPGETGSLLAENARRLEKEGVLVILDESGS